MRVLLLGGTRFAGRATARALSAAGHAVMVASRHQPDGMPALGWVGGERADILGQLRQHRFEVVLDFIAYDGGAVREALAALDAGLYVLISSAWVPRLSAAAGALDTIERLPDTPPRPMLEITWRYLCGKVKAEGAALAARGTRRAATVVRLPIMWGDGDRTGRMEFYRRRFADGGPVIAVDGGKNGAQIVWSEDVANVLVRWLERCDPALHPIWEGLPDGGVPVHEILQTIADTDGKAADLADVPASLIEKRLPIYLEHEPLWREQPCAPTVANLFTVTHSAPTPQTSWFAQIGSLSATEDEGGMRRRERMLVDELRHA